MMARRLLLSLRPALILLPLVLGGCETIDKLNPFQEKQTPLPGDRQPLFPEGVPGVEFGAPPPQPSNSNIPINPNPPPGPQQGQVEQQPVQSQASRSPQSAPARTKGAKGGNPNDAWSGTR
jgi:hypothetical protein